MAASDGEVADLLGTVRSACAAPVSTTSKAMAKKIGWSCFELNKEIEAQNGLSVAEIIALYGQEGFRQVWSRLRFTSIAGIEEPTVLATGGGTRL